MNGIIANSLERVVRFYEENGIDIGGTLTFVYLEGQHSPLSKDVLAQVPGELKGVRDANENFSRLVIVEETPRFYGKYGLKISKVVVEEQTAIQLNRSRELSGLTDELIRQLQDYGVDILVFDRFRDYYEANRELDPSVYLDPLIAHEVWHVVEGRKGVLNSLILEGTAEYAREFYECSLVREEKVRAPGNIPEDPGKKAMVEVMVANMYQRGLEIVRENATSLSDLFDSSRRRKMVREMEAHLRGVVRDRLDTTDESTLAQRGAVMRLFYPQFNVLDSGLNEGNLFSAMREIGMNRTVEELYSQDMSQLLQYYSSLGYGKN